MTGLVNILVEAMTPKERSLLKRVAQGAGLSRKETSVLEKLRLVEVEPVTGRTKLSGVGLEVASRL